MSNALAIAAVTAALRDLINETMVTQHVSTSVGSPVDVTALAPDLVKTDANGKNQLNLFLYQVTPNIGWWNFDQPARDARGARVSRPLLALDLHYLLTAYADKDLHAEILLGCAMQYLHELSVLTREMIRDKQTAWAIDPDASLRAAATSNVAEQIEQIKVCPQQQSVEELSKLWSAFQAKYRPTAAYQVSVVLIESNFGARSALPVLTIGPQDSGVVAEPDLAPLYPTLTEADPPGSQVGVRLNETLTLRGFHLDGNPGDTLTILLTHPRFSAPATLPPALGANANQVQVVIPNDPDNYPAGPYTIAVGFSAGGNRYRTTNELPFILSPNNPTLPPSPLTRDGSGNLTVTATVSPKVWQGQRAALLLGDREAIALPFAVDKTNSLTFVFRAIPPAPAYLYRLLVDGVVNEFIDRSQTPPVFVPGQTVAVT
jgi:hypothetical protein